MEAFMQKAKKEVKKEARKNILITGASGTLGQLAYKHFIKSPGKYRVYATDIDQKPSPRYQLEEQLEKPKPQFKKDHFTPCDITDPDAIEKLFSDKEFEFDVVIHLAAVLEDQPPEVIKKVNVKGAKNVINACVNHNVKRIIIASSIMVVYDYFEKEPYRQFKTKELEKLPEDITLITMDDDPKPFSGSTNGKAYSLSKLTVEEYAKNISKTKDISIFISRFFWVNTDDKPHGRWLDRFRCSHDDTREFFQKSIDADLGIRCKTFFVGSIYDPGTIFDFKECEEIGFKPNHYSPKPSSSIKLGK